MTLVIDAALAHEHICAHPLVNTATTYVALDGVLTLVREHGNPVTFVVLDE